MNKAFNNIRRQRSVWILFLTLSVWLICLAVGSFLSQHKPLWNDEIYSQTRVIEILSYQDLILAKQKEGNNAPFFYLIQKALCDLSQYRFPITWQGEWVLSEPGSQHLLRIPSNIFMSCAIALIFYFFSRFYSLAMGAYALFLTLSSPIIWAYWVEARPYTLWIFLTVVQSLLFLRITFEEKTARKAFQLLVLTHLLLSLTSIMSMAQIILISILIWIHGERRIKFYLWLTLIPSLICLDYYFRAPIVRYDVLNIPSLVSAHISLRDLFFLAGYLLLMAFCKFYREDLYRSILEDKKYQTIRLYLFFMIWMLLSTLFFILVIKMRATTEWGELPSRTFIYLTPIGIMTMSILSFNLVNIFRHNRWMLINVGIILGGLLLLRSLKTLEDLLSWNIYY